MKEEIRREVLVFRRNYERRYGVDLTSRNRHQSLVAARGAFVIFCRKVYPKKVVTYEFLGEVLGRNHPTIIHYEGYEDQKDDNTKFGMYYREAWRNLLTVHPLVKRSLYIERGVLIGANIN